MKHNELMSDSDNLLAGCDILVVDDNLENLKILTDLLKDSGYQVRPADGAGLAFEAALSDPPDLILLDMIMPEMDGVELCRRLKQDKRTEEIPILFVSGATDIGNQLRGFQAGAVDYINKPIRREEVLARVQTHLTVSLARRDLEALVEQRTSALKTSEELFRGVFENAGVGIIYLNSNRKVDKANDFFQKLIDYDMTALKGMALADLIHPEDLSSLPEDLDELSNKKVGVLHFEKRIVAKSGSLLWGSFFIGCLNCAERPMSGFSVVIEDVTAQKQAEQQRDESERHLRKSHQRLRELSAHLQKVREEEKAHIAREIHDEMGGSLAAIKLDAMWLKKKMNGHLPDLETKISNMVVKLSQVISSTKKIVTDLRPTLLDTIGLGATIEWQVREFEQSSGIHCSIRNNSEFSELQKKCSNEALSQEVSISLYRILQEALTNILRHSSATEVTVDCSVSNGKITLSIEDNGIGLDLELLDKPGSYGVRGMYERVEAAGGKLTINTEKNSGTKIWVSLPLS